MSLSWSKFIYSATFRSRLAIVNACLRQDVLTTISIRCHCSRLLFQGFLQNFDQVGQNSLFQFKVINVFCSSDKSWASLRVVDVLTFPGIGSFTQQGDLNLKCKCFYFPNLNILQFAHRSKTSRQFRVVSWFWYWGK